MLRRCWFAKCVYDVVIVRAKVRKKALVKVEAGDFSEVTVCCARFRDTEERPRRALAPEPL